MSSLDKGVSVDSVVMGQLGTMTIQRNGQGRELLWDPAPILGVRVTDIQPVRQ